MKYLSLLLPLLLVSGMVQAETAYTLQGQAYEKGNKRPLSGVRITVYEDKSIQARSDEQGRFSLTLPAEGRYMLTAEAPGYETPMPIFVNLKNGVITPSPVFYLLPAATLKEVVVRAERSPDKISKQVLSGDEIRHAPGTAGDPLRALQSLPGVAMGSDARAAPAVRGSGPADNAYYADTLPVGQLFHIDGSSIFHSSLITDFNLYSAAFAPHYMDVTGAILDVALRDPRRDRLGGKASVSLLGASVLLEGPVNENQSFYLAARRSYFDLLIHQISSKGVTIQLPVYSDYQGKYLWQLNDQHRLSLYMNGASDSIRFSIANNSDTALSQPVLAGDSNASTAYAMQALMLDSILSDTHYNKVALGRSDTRMTTRIGSAEVIDVNLRSTFLREQYNFQPAEHHDVALNGNFETVTASLNLDALNARCTQFNPNCDLTSAPRVTLAESFPFNPWDISARDRWAVRPDVTLIGGVRQSHENYLHQTYTEPRLGVEWAWSDSTLLNAGWGKHNQLPGAQQMLRNFGNPYLSHIRAEHRVVGITRTLDDGWTWKAEAYYKKLNDLIVDDATLNYVNGGSGKAYGLEWLLKKAPTGNLSGWFSLTLAKSERHNDLTGNNFNFGYDQPINATLVGRYRLSGEWTVSTKWTFHTGNPYTPLLGTNGTYPDGRPRPLYGDINSARLPNYHRLDLRFDRTVVYDTWKMNTFFEIINAYAHKNLAGYNYGPNYDRMEPVYQLPFLPTFGIEAEF